MNFDLRKARLEAGISGAELARRLGISPVTVSKMERGLMNIPPSRYPQIELALGCEIPVETFLKIEVKWNSKERCYIAKAFKGNGDYTGFSAKHTFHHESIVKLLLICGHRLGIEIKEVEK